MNNHPDFLRAPENVNMPDSRNSHFAVFDSKGQRSKTFADHHNAVAEIGLHDGVPETIRIQFETSKNIYLYAWFVYRFFPVVRNHVYACLELALSEVFKKGLFAATELKRRHAYEVKKKASPKYTTPYKPAVEAEFHPGLKKLLGYAIEVGSLKNEHFSVWQLKTRMRAKTRRLEEEIFFMDANNLRELKTDDSPPVFTSQDKDHDYLAILLESIPRIRNHVAHGTTALDSSSIGALRVVSEILNQIFPTAYKTQPQPRPPLPTLAAHL